MRRPASCRPPGGRGVGSTPLAALALTLAGCANLAPPYERPAAPVPAAWPERGALPTASVPDGSAAPGAAIPDPSPARPAAPGSPGAAAAAGGAGVATPPMPAPASAPTPATSLPADTGWRQVLADRHLRQVVELALRNNRDRRIAQLDLERARALYRIERATAFPALSAGLGASRQRTPASVSSSGRAGVSETWTAELGLASYEIDFFGRVRNLGEAALQRYLQAEQAGHSAQISLVAEVAQAWLVFAADQERLALAERTLEANQASFELSRRRHGLGADSGLALAQAQRTVDSARVARADARRQLAQDRQALALLVGAELPPEWLPQAGLPVDREAMPQLVAVPEGLPSSVLQRRPDVLAAERALEAAHADIGIARAALFPSISLTAALGTRSRSLSDLFEGGSRSWTLAPTVSQSVFDAGANRAAVQVAGIDREIALATYERTLQTAFGEVADTLALRDEIGEQIDAQRSLVDASDRSLVLAEARWRSGADSYLEVLDARRSLYDAQQLLISLRLSEQSSRVMLYRVLGGGWEP